MELRTIVDRANKVTTAVAEKALCPVARVEPTGPPPHFNTARNAEFAMRGITVKAWLGPPGTGLALPVITALEAHKRPLPTVHRDGAGSAPPATSAVRAV